MLSDALRELADSGVHLPAGYGFEAARVVSFPDDLFDRLLIWEVPRPREHVYVVSVDVGDGIGQDRSVIDVTRVGTVARPDEQVAQWVSAWTDPLELAPIVDAVGRFYTGQAGLEAVVAVETNNHGIATQAELQRHLGYSNLYVWQYLDRVDPDQAQSRALGWQTTVRTRPIMLARYFKKLKTFDPNTGLPDYRINSPITIAELRVFQTEEGLAQACAAPGEHDDCVMAGAIGVTVAGLSQYEVREPMDETRRRVSEQRARAEAKDGRATEARDYINTEVTVEELQAAGAEGALAAGYDDWLGGGGAAPGDGMRQDIA